MIHLDRMSPSDERSRLDCLLEYSCTLYGLDMAAGLHQGLCHLCISYHLFTNWGGGSDTCRRQTRAMPPRASGLTPSVRPRASSHDLLGSLQCLQGGMSVRMQREPRLLNEAML